MPFRRRSLCFVFSSMHPHGCLCRQLPQRKYIFFFGGCPWHADGNRSGCGCLPVRRMCGFYKFFYIPACPWQPGDKGAHPSPVLYRRTARMGIWSIYPGTGRHPLCGRPAGSAICTGCGRSNSPSIPSGNRPGRWAFHPYRLIISSGMDLGMPRLAFRPIKGRMPHVLQRLYAG